ncbi:MAG: sigma-70 family RNA polymerase sigma factor [Planctomycetes bacterium]|nr:sigma-70 family RNA polymerase sigma factor [Planctomycetota bacterium]
MTQDPDDDEILIERARSGDQSALAALFNLYRARLRRMVELRLDRRLRGRIDASDVVQETYIRIAKKLEKFGEDHGDMPFFLWLRLNTGHCLIDLHRRHLGAEKRNVDLEVSIHGGAMPVTDSFSIAAQLLGRQTSPSQRVMRSETRAGLERAIDGLDPLDREILALRHFEELSNGEAALVLQIDDSAASTRYFRAVRRLKKALSDPAD